MRYRFFASIGALAAVIAVASQATVPVAGQAAAPTWTQPRTPDGQPDLQGIWVNQTSTPLERPSALAGKEILTDDELVKAERRVIENHAAPDRRDQKPGTVTDVGRAYGALWRPVQGKPIRRTSLIVDPPDGRVPPVKPEARERFAAWAATKGLFGSAGSPETNTPGTLGEGEEDGTAGGADGRGTRAENPEDRRLSERCITFGGVPRLPGGYNNHLQIVQNPQYVVIQMEMIHDARIVPLDGRPHLPQSIRQWYGDPRGHWEGNTLVVDTTNFTGKAPFRGSFEGLHIVERFTRVDADTINYELSVDDPTTWTRSWKAAFPITKIEALVGGADQLQVPRIFEYACQEGNYGLGGQLRGARAEEAAALRVRK